MSAISATRRAMKELVDGTIRVSLDIDPQYRDEFLANFSRIDMPVAIAPLVSDFERTTDAGNSVPEASKEDVYTGLTRLAVDWCKDPQFWEWIRTWGESETLVCINSRHQSEPIPLEQWAKEYILDTCVIESRKELNKDKHAAESFNQLIRAPYMTWLREKGLGQV